MHRSGSFDWSRRRLITVLSAAPWVAAASSDRSHAASAEAPISSDEARGRLVDGNARFVAGTLRPVDYRNRREALTGGQKPFAVVLACADSRVPPEILFDQGLGDLFTVRVAGNIADDLVLGSMEYAVEHLASPLIVVLGHERCGAVGAAVAAVSSGTMPPPHVASLVAALRPDVESSHELPGDPIENAMVAHVRRTVAALKSSGPVLAEAMAHGRLKIVGAEYRLDSGRVEFFE